MPIAVPNDWAVDESKSRSPMASPSLRQPDDGSFYEPYQPPQQSYQYEQPPPSPSTAGRPPRQPFPPRSASNAPPYAPMPSAALPPSPATYDGSPRPFPHGHPPPPPSLKMGRRPPDLAYIPPAAGSYSRWDTLPRNGPFSPAVSTPSSPMFGPNGPPPPPGPLGGPPPPRLRSRPTTPALDTTAFPEFPGEPARPMTGMSSSSEVRTFQGRDGAVGAGAGVVGNFSLPRKLSLKQPIFGDMSGSPGLPPLPPPLTPSEEIHMDMSSPAGRLPSPSPWQRPRRPSIMSNVSSSTWAPGFSPTTSEFPDSRNGPPRVRNVGRPPLSATRPHFGYGNRVDSARSAPTIGGGATTPWASGDELRSSFRSQLTASSAPGTAYTERSSVLTKESSATSLDAHQDGDVEEPSLEDVMGMYENGFDDDGENHYEDDQHNQTHSHSHNANNSHSSNNSPDNLNNNINIDRSVNNNDNDNNNNNNDDVTDSNIQNHDQRLDNSSSDRDADDEADYYSRPPTAASEQYPPTSSYDGPTTEPIMESADVTAVPQPSPARPASPPLPTSRLDAEIRQSKMIFTSPAFVASVPHLAASSMKPVGGNINGDDEFDEDETERRDSSMRSDTSGTTATTATHQYHPYGVDRGPNGSPQAFSPSDAVGYDMPPMTHADSVQDHDDTRGPSPQPSFVPSTRSYSQPSPPPPGPDLPVEVEEPGSRDRYGFKKESQYISRKQYDDWDKGYTEYLDRRKKKWTAFLKENSLMTDEPNRFPSPSAKTKKFVRKGIPPDWRGAAWFYYAGGPAIMAKHGGLYAKMLQKKAKRIDVEAIERDLHRTFPDNVNFRPPGSTSINAGDHKIIDSADTVQPKPEEPPIISSLRRVLFAFSIYNQNIGYCQSLNFIAGMLLLFVDNEEQCFWLLNVVTHIYLPGTHELSLEGSRVDLSVLMTEIRDTMPAVWDRIGGELEAQPNGGAARPSTGRSLRRPKLGRRKDQTTLTTERLPPITMCMTAWFMSCFIGTLPIETTLRVWDVFFYEGSKTLFRIALAIFKSGESEILSVSDPMEMFGVVQSMPRKMLDANALLDTCFRRRNGFGHLSQGAIDERRQARREEAQQQKLGQGQGASSGGGEGKGLFGRKK
ncbi:TBC1 domain family member 6 [Geosmithia morbida]|uniref:TBC1 domain family member 6 n=1 Tax=Geosmithia morbida TaxID=1094350 RepID=A0A9P4YWF1_9HYPO|nr:TBC1 domain family member 6 [Geosmithia morbida]KAF4122279.1 TBC1 domain family member 6 [Geosmithia morbida]